jgi:hypothetical protein
MTGRKISKAKIVVSVLLAAIFLPLAYLVAKDASPTKFAPVIIEPRQLVSTQDGTYIIELENQGHEALHLRLDYETTPKDVGNINGKEEVYLLPEQHYNLEITIRRYPENAAVPVTVGLSIEGWQKVMRVPCRRKTFLHFVHVHWSPLSPMGGVPFDTWEGEAFPAYYVNESDGALWISVYAHIEPQLRDIVASTSLGLSNVSYLEPGEAIWFYASYGYAGSENPGWHWATLVVDVREYLSEPGHVD